MALKKPEQVRQFLFCHRLFQFLRHEREAARRHRRDVGAPFRLRARHAATTSTRGAKPSLRRSSSQSSHVKPNARTSATPRRAMTDESVLASRSANSPSMSACFSARKIQPIYKEFHSSKETERPRMDSICRTSIRICGTEYSELVGMV